MSEHAPTYHRQNGQSRPIYPDMYSAGAEIEVQYRTAAEVLFAAILREPHIFAAVAHKVHPAWWKQTKYDKAACAVFEQFYGTGKSYSAYTVCKPGGDVTEKDLFEIQGRHADTDLNAALDFFLPIYRQWVEFRASHNSRITEFHRIGRRNKYAGRLMTFGGIAWHTLHRAKRRIFGLITGLRQKCKDWK
jgi:hypothetical protein